MKRRTFIIGSAALGGLILGYRSWNRGFEAQAESLVAGEGETLLGGWVKIGTDDTITVYVPHVDFGQGSHTALAMMLAEELDADWSRVRTLQAPPDKAFANRFLAEGWILQGLELPRMFDGAVDTVFTEAARFIDLQITGGSTAVRITGQVGMRVVGAAARTVLLKAAARRWDVRDADLVAADSVVRHLASGREARFGELAAEAASLSFPASPRLKPREKYKLIGTSVPRLDIPDKVAGTFRYGIDLRLPQMRYAAIRAAPTHGGKLLRVDEGPALAVKGVERLVRMPEAVGVIARSWPQAQRGVDALSPEFSENDAGAMSSRDIDARHEAALANGVAETLAEDGDPAAAVAEAPPERRLSATYNAPFLHHAAMEPINATAQFKDGRLTVWAGDQTPIRARMQIVELSGLPADAVTYVPMPMGGSFGRRASEDASRRLFAQAIALAKAAAPNPVKLIWSREEDFAQGAYRPQAAARFAAAIGPDGRPTAWSQISVGDVVSQGDSFESLYRIPNRSIRRTTAPGHIRVGSWRSVNHSQGGFWTEGFMDELAHAAGRDPFEYRRDLLAPGSRARRVLETAAEKADWGAPLPSGVGRGIALVESYGSIVAEVVEASFAPDGRPQVHRVVAAVDCGGVCHPRNAAAQIEGGVLMGLSAAISEEIVIERGRVAQKNFSDYPIMTLAATPPRIEVHFVASDAPWGGLGEPGLPPAAPALANALFAASGRRIRRLPILRAAET